MKSSLFTLYMKFVFLVVPLVIVCSCATLFNKPYKTVSIYVDTPCKLITEQDTFLIKQEEKIKFQRKNGGITFTTIAQDSVKNDYFIPSKVSSTAYWNLAGFGLPGIVIDLFSPKMYSYPHHINLSPSIKSINYTTYKFTKQGDLYFNFSLPVFNIFEIKMPKFGYQFQGNMFGIGLGLGLDYYYTNNQFLNVSGTSINDFFTLKGTNPYDEFYYTDIRSNYASITNNHKIKKVSLGYGVSYSRNQFVESFTTYDGSYYDSLATDYKTSNYNDSTYSEITQNLGLLFSIKIQAGKYLYASFHYRPSFIQPGRIDPFIYEQYTGFELCYKFQVNKRKETLSKNHQPDFFERNFGHLK